jgi:hypothetical protein
MEFIDRIKLLLGDRTLYGWVSKSLKLDRGIAQRINEGTLPKKDAFWNAVRNLENVREEWLRMGKGAPFYVYSGLSDEDWSDSLLPLAEAAARGEFEYSGIWYLYCENRLAIVLYANAEKQFPDQSAPMPYIEMRIQTGQFGPRTALALKQLQTVLPDLPIALEVTSDLFQRLATGKVGAYELFGDPETGGGLYAQAHDWQRDHYLQPVATANEPLSADETALIDCFRSLTPARRQAVISFLKSFS